MSDSSKAVFLSYASQDAEAARRIADALRSAGVEVWFDQNELVGGDAWDAKIRRQIAACALFVPVISANTQARLEGYFRLEWKLAAQRTHTMADEKAFLLPMVIDETRDAEARVPPEFRAVQWTRLRPAGSGGQALDDASVAAFCTRVQNLLGGSSGTGFSPVGSEHGRDDHATSTPRAHEHPARATLTPRRRWLIGVAAVLVVGLAALAVFSPVRKPAAEKSIAVLPFENLGGDRENEIFSDGVSDELLNVLGKVPGLLVKGRQSSFAFKGKNVPEAEIARTLGVGYIVNGTVQRSGSQVRILARLNRAADGNQIWSERFTEEAKDIFSVQDKIAGLIAQNLQLKLAGATKPKRTVNPEAHRLALEGRHFWLLRNDDGFARAEAAFRAALRLDPDFAEAHAGLADVAVIRGWYSALGDGPATADLNLAREQATLALRLDPTMAGPHAALGVVHLNEWKLAESEQAFQTALRLNPNYAYAHHWRAHLLALQGRLDEALAELERAAQLDPLSFITLAVYALHLEYAGRHAEMVAMADRAMALRADLFVPLQATRCLSLWKLGRRDEAVAAARVVTADPGRGPRWWSDYYIVHVLRKAGLEREAVAHLARLEKEAPLGVVPPLVLLAGAGRTAEVLNLMAERRLGASVVVNGISYSAAWRELREDARFPDALARAGLKEEYRRAQESIARLRGGAAKP